MSVSFADGSKTFKYDSVVPVQVIEKLEETNEAVAKLSSIEDQVKQDLDDTKKELALVQQTVETQTKTVDDMKATITCIKEINNQQDTEIYAIINFLNTPFMRFLNYFACWYYIAQDENTGKYSIQPDNRTDRRIRKAIQKSSGFH